jgi:3-oxoadipate enol-lactonase
MAHTMPPTQQHAIELHDLSTQASISGQGTRTVVMVQGLGLDGASWGPLAQQLAQHQRVVTFDARGAGLARDAGQAFSTQDMARDVVALCAHLQISTAVVLGFSMGGCVAQHVAAMAPRLCEGLVLLSSVARPSARSAELLAVWRDMVASGVAPSLLLRNQLLWAQQDDFYDRPGALQEVMDYVQSLPRTQPAEGFIRQANACIAHDGTQACAHITVPALVLVGPQERVFSVEAVQALAHSLPHARYQCLAHGGHNMWLEHPLMVASAVQDFISALPHKP